MLPVSFSTSLRLGNGGLCQAQGGIHPGRVLDAWVLLFVREQALDMEMDGEAYRVEPDQVLLLPAGIRHRGTAPYPDGLQFYWLHFWVDESEAAAIWDVPLYSTVARPHILLAVMRRLLDDQQSGRLDASPTLGTVQLLHILAELDAGHHDPSGLPSSALHLARQAAELIRARHAYDCSTASIARELGVHGDHLGRVFKQVYGCGLIEQLNRHRIDRAASLFIETTDAIDAIASAVGVTDHSYFRRLFRRYRGMTPSAFRRLHGQVHINM
ncbi:MAG: AraC family transcriptional regulator [Planctomycetota bacterium]|jgi:AraC-like DNA-binding protein|nr:AraC family transcriptional regulator [Planctomycetota bacterium]